MQTLQATDHGELIEVQNAKLRPAVMVRVWKDGVTDRDNGGVLADLRLTAEQARTLAANLLHGAQEIDRQMVSFKWHLPTCTALQIAMGGCECPGSHAAAVAAVNAR